LRCGGGVTHLVELLRAAQPKTFGIERVVVWGGTPTLTALEDRPWLAKRNPVALDSDLPQRTLWQRYRLSQAARNEECDVLFVPGGSYAGNFHPVVTMSRNLLPFEMRELLRYGWSPFTLKLMMLRFTQSRSFRSAYGVIFLTDYAKQGVVKVTGPLRGKIATIPHGLSRRFFMPPRPQRPIADYSATEPYRLLYVSIIDQYKHQWQVVDAVAALRKQGLHIVLDLVGPAYQPALKRLQKAIVRADAERHWVYYHGAIPFNELHLRYAEADLGLFASSCENMPNILLETMAAGLPIACSNRGPMPEVLGNAGVYFDPESPEQIADALTMLLKDHSLRARFSQKSYDCAREYSWERCAEETFAFLAYVIKANKGAINNV